MYRNTAALTLILAILAITTVTAISKVSSQNESREELESIPPSMLERKRKIDAMGANVSAESMQRKKRSEVVLFTESVPVNKTLPIIATEKETKQRSKEEVAYRALALLVVSLKGDGLEQPEIERLIKNYGLEPHFTPQERVFLENRSPSQHDLIQFSWRYESAWTLLWALGYVEKLEKPTKQCDAPRALAIMRSRSAKQFIAQSKLRPLSEILDQSDLIYRYDWAVVDARIRGIKAPADLEPGVVQERHYTLNWLIGYMDQAWDDISTDT
jgi:hypothetical protein